MAKIKKMRVTHYDWNDLVEAVEERSGKQIRDWNGRDANSPITEDYATGNFPCAKWCIEQGYDWTVLNDPNVDEEGMKLRIKINTEYRAVEKEKELPYQDFWHYALSNIFYDDISNGCVRWFNPADALTGVDDVNEDGESQEWVREVLGHFIEVLKENKMKDEIEVWIGW